MIYSLGMLLCTLLISPACSASTQDSILPDSGISGVLYFEAGEEFGGKIVPVHYFVPDGNPEEMLCQIVLHGASRNASEYLDGWKVKAMKYKLILLAPEFDKSQFKISEYTQGNLLDIAGVMNPDRATLFQLLDDLFIWSGGQLNFQNIKYNLYGHSAGGQFVQRFLLFHDSPYVQSSIAANSGWYTYPDTSSVFPYGLGGLPYQKDWAAQFYARDLTILLGTADTLRTGNLRITPEADAQGLNRLERGDNFYRSSRINALSNNHLFLWKLEHVADTGHDHLIMSPAAADILYDKNN